MPFFQGFSTTPSAAEPESYTWACPGAPIRVQLLLSVVEQMGREVKRAFESVPAHSVEIGGLLLGTAGAASNSIVEVKSFEPFLSEYRTDHKFILSEADELKLEKVLAAHANNRMDGLKVVGFYRSHIGEGLSLSQRDVSIAQKYFSDPTQVILVVKPAADGSSTAGFFFWEDHRIDSQFSYLEFPFETGQLTGSGSAPGVESAEQKAQEDRAARRDVSLPSFEDLALESSRPRRLPWLWFALVAILMVGLGAAGYWIYTKWNAAPAASAGPDPITLALQVERKGSDLRVSWNRHSFAIARATEGSLVIRDGDLHEQLLRFDLDELRNGSILYTPANPAVQFRLEVTDQENAKTSETVLALTAAKPDAAAGTVNAASNGNPVPPGGTPHGQPAPIPPSSARDFGGPVRSNVVNPVAPAPGASGTDAALKRGPEAPKPTGPPSQTDSTAQSYTPPQPMHEVQPNIPENANIEVGSLIEVEIRVHIDDKGIVVKAEPMPGKTPASSLLVVAARNAAMHWRFEPAWQGSRPVASELILKFQYHPAAQ